MILNELSQKIYPRGIEKNFFLYFPVLLKAASHLSDRGVLEGGLLLSAGLLRHLFEEAGDDAGERGFVLGGPDTGRVIGVSGYGDGDVLHWLAPHKAGAGGQGLGIRDQGIEDPKHPPTPDAGACGLL